MNYTNRLLAAACFVLASTAPSLAANVLQITEFRAIGNPANSQAAQIARLPSGSGTTASGGDNTQNVDFTSGAASSSALKNSTAYVRLRCSANTGCAVQWGTSPSNATTSNMTISSGQVEYFALSASDIGQSLIFSVIGTSN